MEKHAYLIMAHNHFDLLKTLVGLLDHENSHIFIHIDKKVKGVDFEAIRGVCRRGQVVFPKKRIDVRWGTQSQVKTELLLLHTAFEQGDYRWFHILSGVDLPLRSQQEIYRFFENRQESFLSFAPQVTQWNRQRLSRYHGLIPGKNRVSRRINGWLDRLQEKLGVDRLKNAPLELKKGGNWGSLTRQAVQTLLEEEKFIRRLTRFTLCADEMYKQTVLCRAGCPVEKSDLRLILWEAGDHPPVLTVEDLPRLLASDRLFARKFDPTVDPDVIRRVAEEVAHGR